MVTMFKKQKGIMDTERKQIRAAILPHYPKMGVRVARKRETVLTPWWPHIFEVSANFLCDDIDGLPNTGDDGRCVAMHWVKLKLGPVCGVEEGGVDWWSGTSSLDFGSWNQPHWCK